VTAVGRARAVALAGVTALVLSATATAFAESYHGLYAWAAGHGLHGAWAVAWPLQVDAFIAVGELALFVALADGWQRRSRCGAWAVTLCGLAVSVAGNVGHVAAATAADRLTAAVPPLAAAAALAVGLGVLKRTAAARKTTAQCRPAWGEVTHLDYAPETPVAGGRPGARPLVAVPGGRSEVDRVALAALAERPAMSGRELAEVVGVSERTGRRLRARLATSPVGAAA
jgi:hypothetical protein